ncbi:MAG TPA: DUF2911 domain-containing protein [Blastocatellia bacterium]
MKLRKLIPCIVALCLAVPALAQMNGERGKAEATVKGKKITIDYGRPSLQGRDMLSQAKPGMVWRLGMNQATQIDTDGDLMVAGKTVPAGKYTLWAKKVGDANWVLAFHPKTGIWGSPEMTEGFVAELPLKMATAKDSADKLTISLADMKGQAGIKIQWGTALLSGSFGVK